MNSMDKTPLDKRIEEALKNAPKFDIKNIKEVLKESDINDFERQHGGLVVHTEMYGGTNVYADGTVISSGKGIGHSSDTGIVWENETKEIPELGKYKLKK